MNSSVTNFYAQKYFKDHGEKIMNSQSRNFSANARRNFQESSRKPMTIDKLENKPKQAIRNNKNSVLRGAFLWGVLNGYSNPQKLPSDKACAICWTIFCEKEDKENLSTWLNQAEKFSDNVDAKGSSDLLNQMDDDYAEEHMEVQKSPKELCIDEGAKASLKFKKDNETGWKKLLTSAKPFINEAIKQGAKTKMADVSEGAEHVKQFSRRNFRRSDDKKLSEAYAKESTKEGYDVAGRSYRRSDLRKNADKFIELHEKGLKGAFLLGMVCNKSKDFGLKGTVSQDPANFEKFCNQCWDAFEEARKSGKIVAQEASASLAWIDQFTKYTCSIEDMKRASRVMKVEDPFQACFELGKMRTTPKDKPDNSPYWPLDKDPMKCFMHTLCQLIFTNAMIKNKALADGMTKFTNMTVQLA